MLIDESQLGPSHAPLSFRYIESPPSLAPPQQTTMVANAQNPRRNALGVYPSHFMTPSPAAAEDFLIFLEEMRQEIHNLIMDELQQKRATKWYCVSKIRFRRDTHDGDVQHATPYFRRPNELPLKPITVYRGVDAVDHFIESIIREKDILAEKLHRITPMHMPSQDMEDFQNATHCKLCKKWLGKDQVRDHDHISGKYRQAQHNECNLQLKQRKMIPFIFHILKNYDGHLIM
ncbi:hypothetical protein AVEN_266970-1 [Araneus ventricosus]|uniref:Uncharacterized protein n=1 Tax=Araneus ventricosus TaxID=182803 RepID=A0A4Y2HM24_ARAVE|nr:hypothetical protein AVEN_266970-1 [Araneus ventricosus]